MSDMINTAMPAAATATPAAASTAAPTPAPNSTQADLTTALNTAEALAPLAIQVAGLADPQSAALLALAPVAIKGLTDAFNALNEGTRTAAQVSADFSSYAQAIQATHDAWAAMGVPKIVTQSAQAQAAGALTQAVVQDVIAATATPTNPTAPAA